MGEAKVLMVAEKPSLAQSIAHFLSNGKMRSQRHGLDVHEFSGSFQGHNAFFRMTSVIGHVLSIDFPPKYQSWDKTDPATLFNAPTVKNEANPKAHVCKHLQNEARGCDYLVLWLDCDREGENICFEVMEHTLPYMHKVRGQQVFRAKFSAISAPEIRNAMRNLGVPNENESLSVDARQELDLKVGVAFTRFQTRYFQGKYGNLDASVISYGPCQTPTLNFCVERHQKILGFEPESFWTIKAAIVQRGQTVDMNWGRGKVFDQGVGSMFAKLVEQGKQMRITSVVEKDDRKHRPPGLNTVEMLKVASSALNMGPHHTMQVAERLYTQGYLSYPRTESSAYPPNFDFRGTLSAQTRHPIWGNYASNLLQEGFTRPKGGVDAGDHPPITPVQCATEGELGGDAWRLYDYVARHFLGSISHDCLYKKTDVTGTCGGETFKASGARMIQNGFTAVMPWKAASSVALPTFTEGESIPLKQVELSQGITSPPSYLSESELIGLMEKNGIGTDASISVHINNICERNYVKIESGRRVVPTELGITLIKGYQMIDPELCRPQVRAHVEKQISFIAKGQAEKQAVVDHTMLEFQQKFLFFVAKIAKMDTLFEASFSPLSASGKPFSKCGICRRYMKYISARPMRLYCQTCEDVYPLPQGGSIKQYKGLACPLDGFELVLYSLGGGDGKNYPLCPMCFTHPPFEGIKKVGGESIGRAGMPCTVCLHPTCQHSVCSQGISSCPECEDGTLVLDPVSAPKWRIDCSRCKFLVYLPKNLYSAKRLQDACQECNSALLELNWKKGASPIADGSTIYSGCLICDDFVRDLCEMKYSHTFVARGGRGGRRGRGRRGRGRGRGRGRKPVDPLMSFRDF